MGESAGVLLTPSEIADLAGVRQTMCELLAQNPKGGMRKPSPSLRLNGAA